MLNPRRKFRETNECPFFAPRLRCPFLATLMVSHDCPPARETPFSPRALFTADLAGTRAPRKREKEAEGRPIYRARTAIIFEQLCVNSSYPSHIRSLKFPVCNASSRVITIVLVSDNYSFETYVEESGLKMTSRQDIIY